MLITPPTNFITNTLGKLKSPESQVALLSLSITLFVAVLCGIVGWILQIGFWVPFLGAIVVQLVLGVAANTFTAYKITKQERLVVAAELEAISKVATQLSCAYCKRPNQTAVFLNKRNTFECEFCKQVNAVHLSLTTTQVTTPIESVKLPILDGDTETIAEFKVTR